MHAFLRPSVSVDSLSTRVFSTNQTMQCGSLVQKRDQAGRQSTGRQFLAAVLVFSLCFVLSGVLFAQSDLGTISGFVKDPSGAIVPNAKIAVRNDSGIERQATTNENGYYIIT